MSEQACSIRQELADITDLMATAEMAITDASDPFPWKVSLDGLGARRLQLTEELVAELEAELASSREGGQAVVACYKELRAELAAYQRAIYNLLYKHEEDICDEWHRCLMQAREELAGENT